MNYQLKKKDKAKVKVSTRRKKNESDWSLSVSNESIGHHCYGLNNFLFVFD